jgi:hypothetical protein
LRALLGEYVYRVVVETPHATGEPGRVSTRS